MKKTLLFLVFACIFCITPVANAQDTTPPDSFFDVFFELDTKPGQPILIDPPSLGLLDIGNFQTDSFFDVFFEIEIPDLLQCNPCDVIRAELEDAQEDLKEVEDSLREATTEWEEVRRERKKLEKNLKEVERKIRDVEDPQSWISSGDRRFDARDLRVMEDYDAELWNQYQNGQLDAEQYQKTLRKGLTPEERAARVEGLLEKLQDEADDLRDDLEDVKEDEEDLREEIEDLSEELRGAQNDIAELLQKLKDCLRRCTEEEIDVMEDYGMGQKPDTSDII